MRNAKRFNAAGWMVTGERTSEEDDDVPVELSQERDRMLRLKQRDEVFVIPRDMRVFAAAENAP